MGRLPCRDVSEKISIKREVYGTHISHHSSRLQEIPLPSELGKDCKKVVEPDGKLSSNIVFIEDAGLTSGEASADWHLEVHHDGFFSPRVLVGKGLSFNAWVEKGSVLNHHAKQAAATWPAIHPDDDRVRVLGPIVAPHPEEEGALLVRCSGYETGP